MTKAVPQFRAIGEFIVVAVCTLAFAVTALSILASMMGPHSAGTHDFVEYWASGQQLLHHGNPYDANALQKLERSVGFPPSAPTLVMGNPPSALLLVLPLGWTGPVTGQWLWISIQLAVLVVSVQLLRSLHRHPKKPAHLLAYAFAPVLSCLLAGQLAVFLLLGLVLFLRWRDSHPWLAGASLWLCFLKPHLFVPLGVVLLLWIVLTRSYKILAGSVLAMLVSSVIATAMDPAVWTQYRSMMAEQRIDRLQLPCLSTTLRDHLYPHTVWVQCIPVCLGCVWAICYFWSRRAEWDWPESSSLLMLISLLVAPYSWFTDQTVLIPAMLAAAYATHSRTWIAILALISAGLEIAAIRGVALGSSLYLWTVPAFLIWYLVATQFAPKEHTVEATQP